MAVRPAPGEILEETKRSRVIPPSEVPASEGGKKFPPSEEFWPWIESRTTEELAKWEAEITVYRRDSDNPSKMGAMCDQLHYPPDTVAFSRRWIKDSFGGDNYSVMVKLDKQLRYRVELPIDGPRKKPEEIANRTPSNGTAAATAPMGSETTIVLRELVGMLRDELRAARGGPAAEQAVSQAVQLSGQVFSGAMLAATDTLRNVNGGNGQTSKSDVMLEKFLDKAMDRMFGPPPPPPDPLAEITRMKDLVALVKDFGGPGGQETLAQTLVRVAPAVLEKIEGGMARMVEMREQDLRRMAMGGGAAAPPAALPPRAPNPVPAVVAQRTEAAPAAAEAQAPPPPPQGMDLQSFIEVGIVRIATNPAITVEQGAAEILILLDAYIPELVDDVCKDPDGEEYLLKMFRERPILAQNVPQNPKLTELVKAFLARAHESRTAIQPPQEAAPAEQPPFGGPPPTGEAERPQEGA